MADTSSLLYDYGSLQTTNIHLAMSPLLPPLIQDKDNHNLDVNPTTKQTTGITNAFLTKTQRVQFGLLTLAICEDSSSYWRTEVVTENKMDAVSYDGEFSEEGTFPRFGFALDD